MAQLSGIGSRLYTGETSFNIIGNRKRWYSISAVFILLSIAALLIQGLHLGIEFKGGSSYTVNKSGITVEEARTAVEGAGITGEIIVQSEVETWAIRADGEVKWRLAHTDVVGAAELLGGQLILTSIAGATQSIDPATGRALA